MAQEYVDAVRRSIDGWNRDDFDTCVSIAHPEIEWVSDLAIRMHGPEAVRLDVTEMIDAGDTVVVLAQTRALGDASGVEFEQLIGLRLRVRGRHGAPGPVVHRPGSRPCGGRAAARRRLVAEQHLQPLGASRKVLAMHLGVRARCRPSPGGQVVVPLGTLARARLLVACDALVHGFRASLGSSPFH